MATQDLENAQSQAQTQAACIVELMTALEAAREADGPVDYDGDTLDADALEERAQEMPLSVEVRSDWHTPGGDSSNAEYAILLCTGGPAVRLTGPLGQYNEPDDVRLECQDWFTPWTPCRVDEATDKALLDFARLCYYGD